MYKLGAFTLTPLPNEDKNILNSLYFKESNLTKTAAKQTISKSPSKNTCYFNMAKYIFQQARLQTSKN
jgi:hypothetical protein